MIRWERPYEQQVVSKESEMQKSASEDRLFKNMIAQRPQKLK